MYKKKTFWNIKNQPVFSSDGNEWAHFQDKLITIWYSSRRWRIDFSPSHTYLSPPNICTLLSTVQGKNKVGIKLKQCSPFLSPRPLWPTQSLPSTPLSPPLSHPQSRLIQLKALQSLTHRTFTVSPPRPNSHLHKEIYHFCSRNFINLKLSFTLITRRKLTGHRNPQDPHSHLSVEL